MYWLLACLVVAGCGRFGFEGTSDARTHTDAEANVDAEIDGPPPEVTPFEIEPPSFSTASPIFVDITGGELVIPPSAGQNWIVFASAYLSSTSLHYAGPEIRVLIDGVERGIGGTESIAASTTGPWQTFYVVAGQAQSISIKFQARDLMAGTTTVEHLHAVALPIPAAADLHFGTNDTVLPVTGTTYSTVESFGFTAASAGDYLIFVNVSGTEAPGSSDVTMQWLDHNGQNLGQSFQTPRGSWQSHMLVHQLSLPATPVTFTLQARSGTMAQVGYPRLAALRVAGFGGRVAIVRNPTRIMNASATPTLAQQMTQPPITSSSRYVVIGTAQIEDDCSMGLALRGARYEVDGFAQSTMHAPGNCSYDATYGFLDGRTTLPASFKLQFSSGNGIIVEHRDSTLLVIGVP